MESGKSEGALLFKYVSVERALTCLPEIGDGALRATQPAALNDPFECTMKKKFIETDRESGNRELAETLTEIQPRNPVTEQDVEEARVRHGSLYMGELYRRQLSTRFGIVSFSTDPFHPLLWSHYTRDGSGFAIGYKAEVLMGLATAGIHLQPIRYIPEPGIVAGYKVLSTPESNLVQIMRCKSSHWEYESEWRLIVELDLTLGTGTRDRHGIPVNLFRIPNAAVDTVYYTERTPKEMVSEIEARLRMPNNRYGVRKATKLVLAEDAYWYEEEDAAEIGVSVDGPR
ncbi:MAG: DUF2971 domain-containing protein [Gammaproteobacteria bacterium]|nr:DUF2971 domain-containing protein [Gammaproteobacteria bacterium]